MSTRYVWEKYIRDSATVSFSGSPGHYRHGGEIGSGVRIYLCSGYSAKVEKSTGKIKITPEGSVRELTSASKEWISTTNYPYAVVSYESNSSDTIMRKGSGANYWYYSYGDVIEGSVSIETAREQGKVDSTTSPSMAYVGSYLIDEILEGKVSSSFSNEYPNSAYKGEYYYKYIGSDNIDPTAISYAATVKPGGRLSITVTKSTSIKYSGTITYLYEMSTDGFAWNTNWYSSTSASVYADFGESDYGTRRFRVRAKDDWGFTSETYATGPICTITPDYVISLDVLPLGGGAVSGAGTYASGSSAIVKAAPAKGWEFVSWTENGTAVSASASYTFTVTASRNLTAVFKQKLTAWIGINGKARKGVELYVGVNGKARKVTAAYIGVNGKARRFL